MFVDQAYWQSAVAAKPRQAVWGFLTGGLTWFAVPFTFATTMGLAYIGLSAQAGEALLTEDEVNSGQIWRPRGVQCIGIETEISSSCRSISKTPIFG